MDHRDAIVSDIFSNHRSFLPGQACAPDEVLAGFGRPIMMGGLSREEADLMLSALPRTAARLWLEPLDKGLSGSKVFAARYDDGEGHRRSKPFVMKVGPIHNIDREAKATEDLAARYLHGVELPVYRRGVERGLIIQEYRGLRESSRLSSLRNVARHTDDGPRCVRVTLNERLGPWYFPDPPELATFTLENLFRPYLDKRPSGAGLRFPPPWDDLHRWVEDATGCSWRGTREHVAEARAANVRSPRTIVHGDLHSQNILVDELTGECWPIDFAFAKDASSPLVDTTMLECSLKFLAIPMRSDLRSLLPLELDMSREPDALPDVPNIPYRQEIERVMRTVVEVRRFVTEQLGIEFAEYRRALMVMTYSHSTHSGLNTPYLIASLQILCSTAT